MSMKELKRLIAAREQASPKKIRSTYRMDIHKERAEKAEALPGWKLSLLLRTKAYESAGKSSAKPLITLTPEIAIVIADHLDRMKKS